MQVSLIFLLEAFGQYHHRPSLDSLNESNQILDQGFALQNLSIVSLLEAFRLNLLDRLWMTLDCARCEVTGNTSFFKRKR